MAGLLLAACTAGPTDRPAGSPAAWKNAGTYRVAEGDPVVTFEGCRPSEHPYGAEAAKFNGGFVVAGPPAAAGGEDA